MVDELSCLHLLCFFLYFTVRLNVILIYTQDLIKGITEEVEFHKKEVQILRVEKDELEKVLSNKAAEVRDNLQNEATRVEDDLKKNLSN